MYNHYFRLKKRAHITDNTYTTMFNIYDTIFFRKDIKEKNILIGYSATITEKSQGSNPIYTLELFTESFLCSRIIKLSEAFLKEYKESYKKLNE